MALICISYSRIEVAFASRHASVAQVRR